MTRMLPLLLLTACFVQEATLEEDTLSWGESVDAVFVDVGSGDVSVSLGEGPDVLVDYQLTYTGERPEVEFAVVDGLLTVDDHCRALANRCGLDVTITLPASAHLDVDTGSGDVTVVGLSDGASLNTGSGRVDIQQFAGDLTVDTGSGQVSALGVDADQVDVNTGSGSVDLVLESRPSRVRVDTGSGSVSIELPAGDYAVSTDTGSGDVSLSGVTPDAGSSARIDVDTGSGDVEIVGF